MKYILTFFIILSFHLINAQNDTINLNNFLTTKSNKNDEIIFKYTDNKLIDDKIIKEDNCFTKISLGIIINKKCYDNFGKLKLHLYKKDEFYIQEEYYDNYLKKTFYNSFFDPIYSEEILKNGKLNKKICYKKNEKIHIYFNQGKELFRVLDSGFKIPIIIGDTILNKNNLKDGLIKKEDSLFALQNNKIVLSKSIINGELNFKIVSPIIIGDTILNKNNLKDGLIKKEDSLFALQNNKIVLSKSIINGELNFKWFNNKILTFWNNGLIKSKKIFTDSNSYFSHPNSECFEYFEYDENENLILKIRCSDKNIISIEKFFSGKKTIEISYFLDQFQHGKKIEYFENGYYIISKYNNAKTKKVKYIIYDDEVLEKENEIIYENYDDDFFKTGNLINIEEYKIIRKKIFD